MRAFPNKIFAGDFAPGFMIDLAHKDLRLALELGDELSVPLMMGSVCINFLREARANGRGGDDLCGLMRLLEEHLGVTLFRRRPQGVALSEQARLLLPEITAAFERIGRAARRVADADRELRVASPPTLAARWLVRRLVHFQERHPDIRVRKSPRDLEKLPDVQKQLLRAAWGMLARGGRLVYATCTITRRENRDVIAAFLDAAPDAEILPVERWLGWPGLGEADGFGCQILPGEAGADGFYYAVLTRR